MTRVLIVERSMKRASSSRTARNARVPWRARIASVSSNQTSPVPSQGGSPLR